MKNKFYAALYLLCLFFTLTGCNFNSAYLNREEDKKDAEKVADQFYALVEKNDLKNLSPLLSDQFKATTSTQKLNDYLTGAVNKLGEIKNKKLDHWETKVIRGSNPSAKYVLYYVVERAKFQAKETVTLTAENDQIKVLGYNVNSEGLFK
ncbi:hypothetical protein QF042_004921 [Pedobacter sp. W3I1]|uniref:hypothetical protein n=1 Tax=Pedobacter sp. W3I1 TaxID=3042291 RepID=UPI00278249A5|nr:hypothetical protein [Pedobacter sp. W3I1]MDQ0641356.1 hypothetical protein [Pedobacter sp. W3I1]